MEPSLTPEQIEERCRFVFHHRGGRIGLTTDGMLADAARAALLPVRAYEKSPGVPEWEIHLKREASPKELGLVTQPVSRE
jgi:hypothetical protein